MNVRTVGVEEELLLVDPQSGEPRALASAVLASATDRHADESEFQAELCREQLEFATSPHTGMDELTREIVRYRAEAARHAERMGAAVVALATSPLPVSPTINTGDRYDWMARRFGLTAEDQLTCGCHVHVEVDSDEEGVGVLDRARVWLPVILALSSNSPFWQGKDSGYSSYRHQVWGRWPSAGPTEIFGSAEQYHAEVDAMVATGVLRDKGMVYYDARLSHRYPTVEFRVADVCLDASTTTVLAALIRALTEASAQQWAAGDPPPRSGVGLMRMAMWQAARCGLTDALIHPVTWRPAPAATVVHALVDHVRGALESNGDETLVAEHLPPLLRQGGGAGAQRELFKASGSLQDVVHVCVKRTTAGP
ncbi:glutamate--cysteine ligase [Streptomyces sp. NPDC056690]|uniref:glutamate--cysteine ligase n=1 Tax=unclassified Streptomyces TaxID=2593676 RepID=UPI00363D5D71